MEYCPAREAAFEGVRISAQIFTDKLYDLSRAPRAKRKLGAAFPEPSSAGELPLASGSELQPTPGEREIGAAVVAGSKAVCSHLEDLKKSVDLLMDPVGAGVPNSTGQVEAAVLARLERLEAAVACQDHRLTAIITQLQTLNRLLQTAFGSS